MVLYLQIPFAAIALVLSLTSWRTMRTIKHLDVGKSFWIPVFLSGIFFFTGSIIAILTELGIALANSAEIIGTISLIAVCTLLSGVYMYSKQVRTNLAEKFIMPTRHAPTEMQEENEQSKSIVEKLTEKKTTEENDCIHNFGYLKTLAKNAPIPKECLSCRKIVDCKHSYIAKTEPGAYLADQISAEK